MPLTLRLATEPAAADGLLNVATIGIDDDGQQKFSRTVRLDISPTPREMAQLRWYLEDFPSHPYDPAPTLAAAARTRMRELGAAMCEALRAAGSSPLLDWCLGEGLPETAIEVLGPPGTAAWELLRNAETGLVPLVHARRMVRLVPAGPAASGGRLPSSPRMLLVVSRPAGVLDVPFQSVARPLLSALGAAGTFDVEVVRPPSYPALLRLLSAAREAGRPVDLVHFDGHGLVHEGKGHLVFEGEHAGQASAWIPGPLLGRDLAAAGVRMAVLNACRSADVGAGAEATPVAFRSLAEELVLAGVGGVLAMQYDVRVDTAARFVAPLYEALGAGHPLGESAAIARRELFTTMTVRQAEGTVAATDDWFVPVVYEAQRADRAPEEGTVAQSAPAATPPARRPPAAEETSAALAAIDDRAFHGRDDVLLQLDRAFDAAKIIDLCGLTGIGKSTAARHFARWYAATGGIAGEVAVAEIGLGAYSAAEIVRASIGASAAAPLGRFAGRPGLLIVDDLDALPPEQRAALSELFERLAVAGTKVLVTSHGSFWLEGAAQIRLSGMTDADMLAVLADRLGREVDADTAQSWRPVLDLANGSPLALHVLLDWSLALPEQSVSALRGLVDDVLSGAAPPFPATASTALETWPQAFLTEADWQRLAVLLHIQRYADINHLMTLGRPDTPWYLADIETVTGEEWAQLFVRLSVGGLAWQAHDTYFELHPLFTAAVMAGCGGAIAPERLRAVERAFAFIKNSTGWSIVREFHVGSQRQLSLKWAASEEGNLRHALELARQRGWWELTDGAVDALVLHYKATGRQRERAELIALLSADAVAPDGGPVEGREVLWQSVSMERRDLAIADGDLHGARVWADRLLSHARASGGPNTIMAELVNLAGVEIQLNDPACVDHLAEAESLAEDTDDGRRQLAAVHYHLGMAYADVTTVLDLDRAYEEYGKSAALQHPGDHTNRAKCFSQQAEVLMRARPADPQLTAAFRAEALRLSGTALQLFPPENVADLAIVHARIGQLYRMSGHWSGALAYDTAARTLNEAAGNTFGQAGSRFNVALDLRGLGRLDDARVYATAAAQALAALGEHGRAGAEQARQLLAELDAIRPAAEGSPSGPVV